MAEPDRIIGSAPQTQRQTIYETPETLGNYLESKYMGSFEDSFFKRLYDWAGKPTTGQPLTKQELEEYNKKFGVNVLLPEEGMPWDQYKHEAMSQWKRQQWADISERKPDVFAASALGLGTALVPQLFDPVLAPLNFVPVIGAARYQRLIAAQQSVAGRAAVRFGLGGVEAGVGNLAVEPFQYALARARGDDYNVYDSFTNVAFGIGFGGTIGSGLGFVGDFLNKGFGGVASPIPKADTAEILQAATHKFMRDGVVDVEPLVNAALKRNLMYDLNEVRDAPDFIARLKEGSPVKISKQRAREEYLKDNPDLQTRVNELESKLKTLSVKDKNNIYERALNDYAEAEAFDPQTFNDGAIKLRKLATLDDRYGKGFRKEAEDYQTYVTKSKALEDKLGSGSKDKRNIKSLSRDIKALDEKYNGKFSDAYAKRLQKTGNIDADTFAIKQQLDQFNADMALGVEMKYLKMQDTYSQQYREAKMNFASSVDSRSMKKMAQEVDETNKTISEISDDPLKQIEEAAEDIEAMKQELDEFTKRTEIDINDIDDAEFDMSGVLKAMKDYIGCIRR